MASQFILYDKEFKKLTKRINNCIISNKLDINLGTQEDQVKRLVDLENRFKSTLHSLPECKRMYLKFINFILLKNGNVLSCRPYFREKVKILHKYIYKCIKEKNIDQLMTYSINFQFIQFIIDSWEGRIPQQLQVDYEAFIEARRVLIENNIPLAINRANIFYLKTIKAKKNDLDLLDLINICVRGLMSGIDKYSGDYTPVWRSVCIGMMVGLMIRKYSESSFYLTPTEKKILYRVNILRFRENIEDMEVIVKKINEGLHKDAKKYKVKKVKQVNTEDITNLINSFSQESNGNSKTNDSMDDYFNDRMNSFASDFRVEEEVEKAQAIGRMIEKLHNLNFMELKIIRLKGVDI